MASGKKNNAADEARRKRAVAGAAKRGRAKSARTPSSTRAGNTRASAGKAAPRKSGAAKTPGRKAPGGQAKATRRAGAAGAKTKSRSKTGTARSSATASRTQKRAAGRGKTLRRVAGGLAAAAALAGGVAGAAASGAMDNLVAEAKSGAKRLASRARNGRAKSNGRAAPVEPSTAPWGAAGKALEGVRILDFTHVQSGPTCTQLLAYFGADVIKVERPGVGDITRTQLRDIPAVDSLYFTMLNGNKRSITLDSKNPKGKEVLEKLVKTCDVLVENFAPGALDRMGLTWERIHELNPRMVVASVKGFGPGPYEHCKVYENVAQCAGGSASTTGFREGPPLVTGAQIGDSGTGLHLALGIVCALYQRNRTGRGQKVLAAMQDGVLNLCRVKLRDQQRLAHGPLKEYSQYGQGIPFGDAVPRAGNDSGGGQPGWILKCKGWEADPDAYIYFITQAPVWGAICDVIGLPEWKTDPDYATPEARLPRLTQIFDTIERWTMTKTKFEAMEILNQYDIPCGPILSMKELAEEASLRETGTVVEVDHPTRGPYLTVGNPIKMSDSISDVKRAPLLGEHTDEILREVLGYDEGEVEEIKASGALSAPEKKARAQEARSVAVE